MVQSLRTWCLINVTLHLNGLARGSGKASEELRQVIWPENWFENPRIRRLKPKRVRAELSSWAASARHPRTSEPRRVRADGINVKRELRHGLWQISLRWNRNCWRYLST
jgi:hypothetical protein